MSESARLVLRDDPSKVAMLHRSKPTTIGRAESNRLRLASLNGVADHHAVVRFSLSQGWLVCDWQSNGGTFLEGERIRQCRRLRDGDEIQLGADGPVLVFRQPAAAQVAGSAAAPRPAGVAPQPADPFASAPRSPGPQATSGLGGGQAAAVGGRPAAAAVAATPGSRAPASPGASGSGGVGASLTLAGRSIPLDRIRSAHLRSRPRHPQSFSWWVLLCLGGMVLLPFPWLFWSLQAAALVGWIVLGSRKQHELVITLRDGMAYRHAFANRITALSHRNGLRKAIGQSLDA